MDLNYLLSRHQISLMRANQSACSSSRRSHQGLAAGYAARIRAVQAGSTGSGRVIGGPGAAFV
ncbi:hypothetical protein COC42_04155 [Sphingomonas spermidinifaciens]|uniref:Uncharacterized protein n=1 Tax=Sphingomonas spermidinifaciens TaxID=1141889 RepID=A0A2A4B7E7_9SPHN|nr:hypothetical protein [Sphingomonas spermidinifaciens]PCD03566.1 hypothetical protein COC42_04155 [Sphingomonas spermidinifaciens]